MRVTHKPEKGGCPPVDGDAEEFQRDMAGSAGSNRWMPRGVKDSRPSSPISRAASQRSESPISVP
jgi:hypothetical protein